MSRLAGTRSQLVRAAWFGIVVAVMVAVCAALPTRALAGDEKFFVIEGHGYGHGVGMGQFGAEGYAAHGSDYRAILAHYYPRTALARAPAEAHVRVLLLSSTSPIEIGSVNAMHVVDASGREASLLPGTYTLDTGLTFRRAGRKLSARPPIRILPSVAPLTLNGSAYHGALIVSANRSGLEVVNDVSIDEYVRGVIAWEMPSSWHIEALRAQAVAARSYALASLSPNRAYDVYPDQRSQMYGGLRAERAATNEAVLSTLRQVLVWNGRVASTFFSSSSGGRTADATDVWPSDRHLPYLVSVPDPYDSRSPNHHWGPYVLAASTLAGRLGLHDISAVRTISDGSGRVAYLQIHNAHSVVRISGPTAARLLGLRSTYFTIKSTRDEATPATHAVVTARHFAAPASPHRASPTRTSTETNRQLFVLTIIAAAGVTCVILQRRRSPTFPQSQVAGLTLVALATAATAVGVDRVRTESTHALDAPGGSPASINAAGATKDRPSEPLREGPTPNLPSIESPAAATGTLEWREGVEKVAEQAETSPPPAATTSATTKPAAPTWSQATGEKPAPPAPLDIRDVQIRSLSSSTIAISWRTNLPAITQGARGLGLEPWIWASAQPAALDHETTLTGLGASTAYHVWLFAEDDFGQTAHYDLLAVTPPTTSDAAEVVTDGDAIVVDAQPIFPIMLWSACVSEVGPKLEVGINVFMGNGCGRDSELVRRLDGRGLAVVSQASVDSPQPGVLGWYYPDEWDAGLPGSINEQQLRDSRQMPAEGGLSFLTLTNHFYSRASPLPQGKGMYPALLSLPDVVGFDLYPLQTWCRPAFGDVFDAQAELHAAAGGKPTFQWIEVAPMEHPCNKLPELNPTAETVRAETWLAVAGGADAIGYFPNDWSSDIDASIAQTNSQIRELAPALLAPETDATSTAEGVKVSARSLNGALYIIAVNTTSEPVQASIQTTGLAERTVDVFGENRTVTAASDSISDEFDPLAVHIYIAPPAPWDASSLQPAGDLGPADAPAADDHGASQMDTRFVSRF